MIAAPFLASLQSNTPQRTTSRWLIGYAWAVLGFMVLVILWGAFVRISGSGAGCGTHWPLCNNELFPQHPRLTTIIEFTHRSMSGVLTVMVAALALWTFAGTARLHPARRAVVWVVLLLITEAILGAVLVLGGFVDRDTRSLRAVMQCIHFTNTLALVAALTLTAWWLHRRPRMETTPANASRPLALAAVLMTMLAGATGSVAALADTLFPSPTLRAAMSADFAAAAPLIVRMRWLHPASALLSVLLALLLMTRTRRHPAAIAILWLVVMQVVLGVADVLLLAPTWLQILHLLGADLFWIALVMLTDFLFLKRSM
jgi:cytochrome c oxidase assembly protein subunit 15